MARALFFLLFLTIFSLAALWFVENDGSIVVEWVGYRIQTSVAFAILFSIITIVVCTLFLQIILWIKSAPKRYRKTLKDKKLNRGLTALTQGFAAIAAGDIKQARTLSVRANSNLDNMPLTKLLAAQTAQLEGNRQLAQEHYTSMLGDKETEIIAIKGLLLEAKQDDDINKALFLAEKAYALRPDTDWVILILLELSKKLKRWPTAEDMTRKALKHKLITREISDRTIGLISFARYKEQFRRGSDFGENYIKEAYKLAADFPPITIAFVNSLVEKDKIRKAIKILESKWCALPHPDIATAYMEIYNDGTEDENIEKAKKLLKLCNGHPEGHIIVASTLLKAGQFGQARHHLKIALSFGETQSICHLMTELETMEKAKYEVIHYWRDRANAAHELSIWKCHSCNSKFHQWHTNCTNCNGFDTLEWKDFQNSVNVIRPQNLLEM